MDVKTSSWDFIMDYAQLDKNAMYVDVNRFDWTPELDVLARYLVNTFDAPTRSISDGVRHYVEHQDKMSQAELDTLLAQPCSINKAAAWILQPSSILENPVDDRLPDSTYEDADGVEQRRIYSEYCSHITMSVDGTQCLLFCGHTNYGTNYGYGTMDAELRVWLATFGSLICKQDYEALKLTPEWAQPTDV